MSEGKGASMNWLLTRAIVLATEAHILQKDLNGEMYIFHPLRVMLRGKTYEERIVGVLHDVVEDTVLTLEYLDNDFPPTIMKALDAITHKYRNLGYKTDESNVDYLTRVCQNPLAKIVKGYDLDDNSDPNRGLGPNSDPEVRERVIKKHAFAYEFLKEN